MAKLLTGFVTPFFAVKISIPRALVQWLWEETRVPQVVSSNPISVYWMEIFKISISWRRYGPQSIAQNTVKTLTALGAAIAQWIRLRLPSCHPGFESQPHHLRFYQNKDKFVLYLHMHCEKNEDKQKEAGFGPFKKLKLWLFYGYYGCKKRKTKLIDSMLFWHCTYSSLRKCFKDCKNFRNDNHNYFIFDLPPKRTTERMGLPRQVGRQVAVKRTMTTTLTV